MRWTRIICYTLVGAALAFLASCGGGGGGNSENTSDNFTVTVSGY
jgi:hypothetical protein